MFRPKEYHCSHSICITNWHLCGGKEKPHDQTFGRCWSRQRYIFRIRGKYWFASSTLVQSDGWMSLKIEMSASTRCALIIARYLSLKRPAWSDYPRVSTATSAASDYRPSTHDCATFSVNWPPLPNPDSRHPISRLRSGCTAGAICIVFHLSKISGTFSYSGSRE